MFNQIEDLSYRLKQDIRQYNNHLTPISVFNSSSIINPNELDQSFMYSLLLKEIILDMPFDNETKKEYVEFCRIQYAGNDMQMKKIDEFEENYQPLLSIQWYTKACFIYWTLNKALRNQDTEIIIKMGFFLRDLHYQIKQLHSKMKSHDHLRVFRGQGVSLTEFEKIKNSKGGLLSFNSFLSTSTDEHVGDMFADSARQNPDLIGIKFKIEIDFSISTQPFASIKEFSSFEENEILFSMHTVFRIVDIQEIENRLWQIDLIVTSDDDPHLTNLTKYIRNEIDGSTALHRMGHLMIKLGKFDKAEEFYNKLLNQTSDNNYEAIAHLNHQLGIIKQEKGDLSDALTLFSKTSEIMQQQLSANHPDLSILYYHIGLTYQRLGKHPDALSYYEKSLEIERKSLSSDDPKLATTYCNIGLLYNDMGEYAMALSYYEKVLEIQQKSLPLYHPYLSTTYHNIALAHYGMGNYSEALSYYKKALEIQNKSLPTDHFLQATTYCNIASTLNAMGKYSEAFDYHKKTLEIEPKSLSSNHPGLAITYCTIGFSYHEMGQYSLALTNYEKAIEIQKKSLPSNHLDLANTYNHIGLTYEQIGEYSKALSYYEMALDIQRRSPSSNSQLHATTFNNIGSVYASIQKYSNSLYYYKEALKIRLSSLPSNHSCLSSTYNNIGLVYTDMGKYKKALSNYEKAIKIQQKSLASDHPLLAITYNNIGLVHQKMEEYSKALAYYNKTFEIQQKYLSPDHPYIAITLGNIASVQKSLGYYQIALTMYCLDQCPIEITNALQANRWFVSLGDPGSAKTTLLRWITHIFAEAAYHEDEEIVFEEESVYLPIRIPIRIRIVEFAEWLIQHQTKTLIDYIGEHTWFSERYCHAEDGNVLKELIYHDYALILLVELMGGASSFF
ncbi:unnamed protein product [Rotaria sp. Silwood1]|nr:unnamed protein product [Rotaria sp. Silwood1]